MAALGEYAVRLAKTPLGIIALFVLLTEAIASAVLISGSNLQTIMVLFLFFFPTLVVFMFWNLLVNHNVKLYAPSEFQNTGDFLEANKIDPSRMLREFKNDILADLRAQGAITRDVIEPTQLETKDWLHAVEIVEEKKLTKGELQILRTLSESSITPDEAEKKFGSTAIKKLKDLRLLEKAAMGATSAAAVSEVARILLRLF